MSDDLAIERVSSTAGSSITIDTAAARKGAIRIAWLIPIAALLFVAFILGASPLMQSRSQQVLLQRFATEIPTGSVGSLDAFVPAGSPVAIIEVPSIGLRQVVVEGTSSGELMQGPGHVALSPLPGEYGNAVILGRHSTFGAPFAHLGELASEQPIVVTTGQGVFEYRVTSVAVVAPEDRSYYQPLAENRLTLVTGASSMPGGDRLVVTAALHGDPVGVANRPWIAIADPSLGAGGSSGGVLLALLWGTLLVVACVAATRMYRRYPPLATYLMTVPTLLLLLWLACTSAARALPGTW